jgi:hypothetical protein
LKKVYLGYYQNLEIKDKIPVHFMFSGFLKQMHDLVAPFHPFMKTTYTISYDHLDDDFSDGKVSLSGKTTNSVWMTEKEVYRFDILISSKGIGQITVYNEQFKLKIRCEN